jgi:hypothetical protein
MVGAWEAIASPLTLPHSQTDLTPNLRIAHGDEFILPQYGAFLFTEPISSTKDRRERIYSKCPGTDEKDRKDTENHCGPRLNSAGCQYTPRGDAPRPDSGSTSQPGVLGQALTHY